MAKIDRFYIGYNDSNASLQTSLKPFAIPDEAFAQLNNAYVFRGRVRKRFGERLLIPLTPYSSGFEQLASRLRINLGNTDDSGNFSGTVPGDQFNIGQMFAVGTDLFTVYQDGTPGDMLSTNGSASGTYNTSTGAVVIMGSQALTAVYFFPALPVMGLLTYLEPNTNVEGTIAFDTRFSYQYGDTGWEVLVNSDSSVATWSGSNLNFFWGTNWIGNTSDQIYFFAVNFNAADGIAYYNNTYWTDFYPVVSNTNRLTTAQIVLPFRDRLIFLNTIENQQGVQFSAPNKTDPSTGNFDETVAGSYSVGQFFVVGNTIFTIASVAAGAQAMTVSYPGTITPPTATFTASTGELIITGNGNNRNLPVYFFDNSTENLMYFVNRCRYSLNGSPIQPYSFLENLNGGGGYLDAPTKEAIVTAQFLKDRLIVYFEQSTWELVYTANQVLPFVWQQINTELGAEGAFSQVPFDKVVLGVGNVGVHACSGYTVERIDDKIPDEVFDIHDDNNSVQRVYGIRDYYAEMVYWTFPSNSLETDTTDYPYCNRILVYNYKTGSWAFNDDTVTVFGNWQTNMANTQPSPTWESLDDEVSDTWEALDDTWGNPQLQSKFRSVIAGNQQGFTFLVDIDEDSNCQALQITDMTNNYTISCVDHNLEVGDYILVENCQGVTGLNGIIVQVQTRTTTSFTVDTSFSGSYEGGGTITRITPIDIYTKQYNFYAQSGRNAYISKVDFLVDRTDFGQVCVDFFVSSSPYGLVSDGMSTGALVGTSILDTSPYPLITYEQFQDRLWHPLYFLADGEYIQLRLYFNDILSRNVDINSEPFELHAMTFYATPTSSRLQ